MICAHDIVLLDKKVLKNIELPGWFAETDRLYATVRRGIPHDAGSILVGLRGKERQQRFGFEATLNKVEEVIHPWELVTKNSFRQAEVAAYPVYHQYREAQLLLKNYHWGVGGSLGFELATQRATIKSSSDLDLLLYADSAAELPMKEIEENMAFFEKLDTQIISQKGGFALKEYLSQPSKKILLKTNKGPKLTTEIW
ncbi:malonate decarboxylase holo-ACP synthase [Enterococcus hermanniensis]|uniref:Malonate decarboxylase n=1 Tax=Enterococcus hermanniensis TaxID=249189 RepID=A0A1L8TQH6_9ENTE|nr:malonate decarboxylase holo-ACP synthase [Enterococcus hermanniensis]OJG46575.1 malonate decarboxylase [Enterococcus hermanniensis]